MLPFSGDNPCSLVEPEIVPNAPAGVIRQHLLEDDAAGNVRALIKAQAISSYIHSRWMGVDISGVYVTGGASANEEILKIFANVHGCPVHRFETTNAAALGAALSAFQGHRPDTRWSEITERFCRPDDGSTIQPDTATRAIYEPLISSYGVLEREHFI